MAIKKENTKLMIGIVAALCVGFIIGLVITGVVVGNTIKSINAQNKYENLTYEDVFSDDFKIKIAVPLDIAAKLLIDKFGANVLTVNDGSADLCELPDGGTSCTCGSNGFVCPCHNSCMIGGTYTDEDGGVWVVPGTIFTTCADWSTGWPNFPNETNK